MKKTKKPTSTGKKLARIYRIAAKEIALDSIDFMIYDKPFGCCRAIQIAAFIEKDHNMRAARSFNMLFEPIDIEHGFFWWPTRGISGVSNEELNRVATPRIIALELAALMAEEGQLTTYKTNKK